MLKFTIATCTFNALDNLPPTIQSVKEQTYPNVEHLIIDGASTDGSVELLKRYSEEIQKENHSVSLISEPDKGLYDAMNKVLQKASGDYILFINAGDRLHSADTLEKIAAAVELMPIAPAIVYGNTDIIDSDGNFLRSRRLQPPSNLNWKSFRKGMLVCHQAFMVSKVHASKCDYDRKYRFSADFDWCIRLMKKAELLSLPILNSHLVIADYLSEGLTTKNHKKSLRERFTIMTIHYGLMTTILYHFYFIIRSIYKK